MKLFYSRSLKEMRAERDVEIIFLPPVTVLSTKLLENSEERVIIPDNAFEAMFFFKKKS